MLRRCKNTILDLILIDDIEFEGILDLSTIAMDFVQCSEFGRNDDSLGQLFLLLAFIWIISVLLGHYILKLLAHFGFQILCAQFRVFGQFINISINQIGPHANIVIGVDLQCLPTLLLNHLNCAILILI